MRSIQAVSPSVRALLLLLTAVVTGCSDSTAPITAPVSTSPQFIFYEPAPIQCRRPGEEERSSAVLGPLGGVVSAGGMSISLPIGALLEPTRITVVVANTRQVMVDIKADGQEHFLFRLPVTVTMSYARCTRPGLDLRILDAWYWDADTGTLLEKMNGIDNKLLREVTFVTPHLSGYVIAN